MNLNAFRGSMLDCEIIRNGITISTHKGLIFDTKDHNVIKFEPNSNIDIQIGDDIYCPLKDKHYIIINKEISTFRGQVYSINAYFENNFTKPISNTTFNTYNPTNSIIGNQQIATINITESFKNLNDMIAKYGNEDKPYLNELVDILKSELNNNQINKSKLSKFSELIAKHSWLPLCISQIIAAWLQKG